MRESGAVDVTCDGLDAGTVARCKVFAAFRVRLSQGQYEGVDVYMQQYRKLEVRSRPRERGVYAR